MPQPRHRTWVMFMLQNLGPHMEQKWAVLAGSCIGNKKADCEIIS